MEASLCGWNNTSKMYNIPSVNTTLQSHISDETLGHMTGLMFLTVTMLIAGKRRTAASGLVALITRWPGKWECKICNNTTSSRWHAALKWERTQIGLCSISEEQLPQIWLHTPPHPTPASPMQMRRGGASRSCQTLRLLRLNVCASANHLPDYSRPSQTSLSLPGQLGEQRAAPSGPPLKNKQIWRKQWVKANVCI